MIVFKDFMDSDLGALAPLRSLGYLLTDGYPTAVLPIDFSSLDGYFAKLSYATRKDLRRKIKQTNARGGVDVQVVNRIDDWIEEIYQLYLNMYAASSLHFELLTKEFFLNYCRYMPEQALYFLYRVNGRLVAFNFCLARDDALADKYIALDHSVSRDYNLYLISFLNNVQWCLDHGKRRYLLSQGGNDIKARLGAEFVPLRALTKLVIPVTGPLLDAVASRVFKHQPRNGQHEA